MRIKRMQLTRDPFCTSSSAHPRSRRRALRQLHAARYSRRGAIPPSVQNQQTPHVQDEIYLIIRGQGILFHDGEGEPFESGDLLFVAAGAEHRFGDISEDLAVWRVFYGARGGEVPV